MQSDIMNQFIRSLNIIRKDSSNSNKYPFCLPIIKKLDSLKFHPKVTFIVGENGSGKSTLLEAIAVNYGFNPEGGTKNFNFSTMDSHSELYDYINLVKGIKKPKDGFFLRAESLYNVASNIDELDKELCCSPRIIDSYEGISLHKKSHGESFFSIFINRFSEKGIYILDEPKAALSPSRQMAMITRIHELVENGSQFIIATHSPILIAYPNSIIYEIDESGLKNVEYEESQHYQITKAFLSNTSKFLDILIDE